MQDWANPSRHDSSALTVVLGMQDCANPSRHDSSALTVVLGMQDWANPSRHDSSALSVAWDTMGLFTHSDTDLIANVSTL
jgi:hypothetical protein